MYNRVPMLALGAILSAAIVRSRRLGRPGPTARPIPVLWEIASSYGLCAGAVDVSELIMIVNTALTCDPSWPCWLHAG